MGISFVELGGFFFFFFFFFLFPFDLDIPAPVWKILSS
jgi:hypothetical protein